MIFSVADDCVRLGLRAGAVVFRNVRVGASGPELRADIVREAKNVQAKYVTAGGVRSSAEVTAYHDILRKVGVNPRKLQNSVDRLLTYALKRGDLPTINNLVDIYNLVSIRTGCSLGAHDLDLIATPVTLRLLTGAESFTPLGAAKPEAVVAGEFGYVDAQNRLLCRLDVVQADFSKVTADSGNVLLIVEGTATHADEVLHSAYAQVIELVTKHCGGSAEVITM